MGGLRRSKRPASDSDENADARTIPPQPQCAVLESARRGLGSVRAHTILRRAAVRETLELCAGDRRVRGRRFRAVDADALHLPAAMEPAARPGDTGRVAPLLFP